ncbi:hypothetical protein BN2475_220025 [Paraburkholderia ribeironis]|uniref:Uncharacterized protein n=1 Tax=Paraburkholderia ribeironis TaxID=1247936 RepID=A0A1N7RX51_9BURK|nr:hypothetical protein BN2475_220025 [Paraburkholderia ribeironis]
MIRLPFQPRARRPQDLSRRPAAFTYKANFLFHGYNLPFCSGACCNRKPIAPHISSVC